MYEYLTFSFASDGIYSLQEFSSSSFGDVEKWRYIAYIGEKFLGGPRSSECLKCIGTSMVLSTGLRLFQVFLYCPLNDLHKLQL